MGLDDKNVMQIVLKLYEIKAIKFGEYKIKSGSISPIYFDLRVIVSYPDVLETISNLLYESGLKEIQCEHVCGVPYTALPIATLISVKSKLSMLIRRKEVKEYGTKKIVEGHFKAGDRCVIVEDVITSGSSVIETANDLRKEGLTVSDAVVILDRQQGGKNNLQLQNINVKSLFTIKQMLDILVREGKIDLSTASTVEKYINMSQTSPIVPIVDFASERLSMSFEKRSELTNNSLSKQLYKLMLEKKSNLCIAADLTSCSEILQLIDKVGPYVCILKTHVDIINDYSQDFIDQLVILAKKHKVFIMEDRKYADIGNTVALQYSSGAHNVVNWADFVTVHSVSGPGVLNGIKSVLNGKNRGVFVVAEMSCQDNLITSEYTNSTVQMCNEDDTVVGFVCQNKNVIKSPQHIQLTPGVKLCKSNDNLGQNYNSPEDIVLNKGADIAVVGRGITESTDPANEAKLYRDILWKCYEKRIK